MLNERSIDVDRYLYFKIVEILVKKFEGAKWIKSYILYFV